MANSNELLPGDDHKSLTPHQVIQRHSEHPEQPITDADMNNMKLSDEPDTVAGNASGDDPVVLSQKEKDVADNMAHQLNQPNTGMAYKAKI